MWMLIHMHQHGPKQQHIAHMNAFIEDVNV